MPFTFAHPAIVLPFSKIRAEGLSLSALVMGSMTPDFEYILQMKLEGRYSHTLAGMFAMDLPIGISLFLIFHLLVKRPLIENSPHYFQTRLAALHHFNATNYLRNHPLWFIALMLLGIGSHILWDGFTHANGDFVSMYPLLSIKIDHSEWPLFRYLQHLSTAIGFITIGIFFHLLPTASPIAHKINLWFWLIGLVVTSLVFGIRAMYGFEYYGYVIVSIMSASLAGLVISSFIYRAKK